MIKLKTSQIKKYREDLLANQKGLCCICGHVCESPALEHAHQEPHKDKIRGVACRVCNIYEGKIRNASVRTGGGLESIKRFHPSLHEYITIDYSEADWHPSKRKSELIAFRKLNAHEQELVLIPMGAYRNEDAPKKRLERIAWFKKLNAKT